MKSSLELAVDCIGSQNRMAAACGVSRQAVNHWVKQGRPPAHQVLTIEKATEGRVNRYQLRPDVFGEPFHAGR